LFSEPRKQRPVGPAVVPSGHLVLGIIGIGPQSFFGFAHVAAPGAVAEDEGDVTEVPVAEGVDVGVDVAEEVAVPVLPG
jgi:hypothetical protein